MPRRGADPDDFPTDERPVDAPVEGDVIVGHSELNEYRHCPLKHYLSYTQGWHVPKEDDYLAPTAKGQQWHKIMEALYLRLRAKPGDWDAAMSSAWDAAEPIINMIRDVADGKGAEWGKDLNQWADTLDWMVEGYGDVYGWHADRFEVKFVEQTRWCRLPQLDGTPSHVVLRFTPDLVVRDVEIDAFACIDHKSTGTSLGQVNVDLNDQFGLYPWALTRSGFRVTQFWCSQAHTKKLKRHMVDSERFRFLPTNRSVVEQHAVALDAYQTAMDVQEKRASGRMPFSAPDTVKCRQMCQFEEAHIMLRRDGRRDAENLVMTGKGFERGGNRYQRDMRELDEARLAGI